MSRRLKIGITLTEDTLKKLDEICKIMGLEKSYAISLMINSYVINDENYRKLRQEELNKSK